MRLSMLSQAELRRRKEQIGDRPQTSTQQKKRAAIIAELNRRFAHLPPPELWREEDEDKRRVVIQYGQTFIES